MIVAERPWALAALAIVVPLVWWWHRRRARPRTVVVSGLDHWRAAASTVPARRRAASLELAVALATAAALVVAAAGPVVRGESVAPRWTVVVDRSASVASTRVETPYASAVERIRAWAAASDPVPVFDVVAVPPFDAPATLDAVAAALPAAAAADSAFDRAVGALVGPAVVISDRPPPEGLAADVGWIRLATPPGANAAIAWVHAHARPPRVGIFNGDVNGDADPIERSLELVRDGRVTPLASCRVAPGETATIALPTSLVLADGDRLRLAGTDANPLDDAVAVVGAALRVADVVADGPIPAPLVAALDAAAGLRVVRRLPSDAPDPAHAVVYWRVSAPTPAPIALAFAADGVRFGALTFGASVAIGRVQHASGDGDVSPVPSRVARAFRVSGTLDGWRVLASGIDAEGGEHPLLLARDSRLVVAFDPIDDAPGWVREPGFPALVFEHFERARGHRVDGVLATSESRAVVGAATARAPTVGSGSDRTADRSFVEEALAAALVGLVALALLAARPTRGAGRGREA